MNNGLSLFWAKTPNGTQFVSAIIRGLEDFLKGSKGATHLEKV